MVGGRLLLPSGTEKERAEKGDHSPCIVAIYLGLIVMVLPVAWPDFFPEWGGGLKQR